MNVNTQVETFRQGLIQHINNANLPISIVYFVLKDCLNEAATAYEQVLKQEQIAAAAPTEESSEVSEDDE